MIYILVIIVIIAFIVLTTKELIKYNSKPFKSIN